jgi:predicted nuclease of predicted toxin-antitoxin system
VLAKLLADENVPARTIDALRAAEFEVISIRETAPGISDIDVLALAVNQGLVLLTFDRDYGELIYRQKLEPPISIIYFRILPINPLEISETVISLLQAPEALNGAMLVVTHQGIRRRYFPKRPSE